MLERRHGVPFIYSAHHGNSLVLVVIYKDIPHLVVKLIKIDKNALVLVLSNFLII
jgi:uncharacterized membrane-anchored protein YitT (DUF2179 family)